MQKYDGYLISFVPGSRGRLFASLLHKLVYQFDSPINFTELGSAHNDNSYGYVDDPIKYGLPSEYNVLWTHRYIDKNYWDRNIGILLIKIDNDNFPEISLNAAIKNIFPKIISPCPEDDQQQYFMRKYEKYYHIIKDFKFDMSLLEDDASLEKFLRFIANDGYLAKGHYRNFFDNQSQGYNDDVLSINYGNMFSKDNTNKYTTLTQLTTWIGIEYNDDIHSIYEEYDRNKYKIFDKYCPWFKGNI